MIVAGFHRATTTLAHLVVEIGTLGCNEGKDPLLGVSAAQRRGRGGC